MISPEPEITPTLNWHKLLGHKESWGANCPWETRIDYGDWFYQITTVFRQGLFRTYPAFEVERGERRWSHEEWKMSCPDTIYKSLDAARSSCERHHATGVWE